MAYRQILYCSKGNNSYVTEIPALPGCMAGGLTIFSGK